MQFEDRLNAVLESFHLVEKFIVNIGQREWESDDSYGEEISTRLGELKKPGRWNPSIGRGEGKVWNVYIPIFAYTPSEISRIWAVLNYLQGADPNKEIIVTGRRGYFYQRDGQVLPYNMASTADQKRARESAGDSIILTKVNGKPLSAVLQTALPAEIRSFFKMPKGEEEEAGWLRDLIDQLADLEDQGRIRSYDIGRMPMFKGYIGLESTAGRYDHAVMLFSPKYAHGFYVIRDKMDLPIENGNNIRWDEAIRMFAYNKELLKKYPHRDRKVSFRLFIMDPEYPQGVFLRRDFRMDDIISFAKGGPIEGVDYDIRMDRRLRLVISLRQAL